MCTQETLMQLVSGLYMLPSWCTALSGREQVLVVRHTASGLCFKSLPACKNPPSPSSPIPRLEVILFLRHSSGASCLSSLSWTIGFARHKDSFESWSALHLLHVPLVLCIKKLHIKVTRGSMVLYWSDPLVQGQIEHGPNWQHYSLLHLLLLSLPTREQGCFLSSLIDSFGKFLQ